MDYLPKVCLLHARLVNRQWNEATITRLGAEFPFILNGKYESPEHLTEKVQALLQSKIEWTQLKFKELNFLDYRIRGLLGPISQKFKATCKSIALKFCKLELVDFIQIIAHPENLEHLKVKDCPSILHSNLNVLQVR